MARRSRPISLPRWLNVQPDTADAGPSRFTRLSNGFSKKLENHIAAVSLFIADYNLCRVHETIRMTPAMSLGVTYDIWTIGELTGRIGRAAGVAFPGPALFTLIKGGI